MNGPMPTRDGDIVISHGEASPSLFVLWQAIESAQQDARVEQYRSTALGRAAALTLARLMAAESRGAIFLLETALGTWTELS
jgi:hypothetical protein